MSDPMMNLILRVLALFDSEMLVIVSVVALITAFLWGLEAYQFACFKALLEFYCFDRLLEVWLWAGC